MKKTNPNQFSSKAVQHGLERTNTGKLQTLWIEVPPLCNLACSYCYARGGEHIAKQELLTKEEYLSILNQAEKMGVDGIGIPGAGEPLFGANKKLTMWILKQCAERGFYAILFTTGEFITEELAVELFNLPVEVMLKGNTLDPIKQDLFVSDQSRGKIIHGYGEKRNRAIEILAKAGFNDPILSQKYGRKSRMALVTSIMTNKDGSLSNMEDVVKVYRFCRDRNIIADIDTILERGRAIDCSIKAGGEKILNALTELRSIAINEYGDKEAVLSSTYVETVCDRYHHHLYIDVKGQIRPCIGAMDVNLGSIKNTTLKKAWNSKERRIIRERKYAGVCPTCMNFKEFKCHSCLGRRTLTTGEKALNNENLLRDKSAYTTGCPLFRK